MTQNDNVSIYLGKGKHLIERKGNILSNMIPRKHRLESRSRYLILVFFSKAKEQKLGFEVSLWTLPMIRILKILILWLSSRYLDFPDQILDVGRYSRNTDLYSPIYQLSAPRVKKWIYVFAWLGEI